MIEPGTRFKLTLADGATGGWAEFVKEIVTEVVTRNGEETNAYTTTYEFFQAPCGTRRTAEKLKEELYWCHFVQPGQIYYRSNAAGICEIMMAGMGGKRVEVERLDNYLCMAEQLIATGEI